MDARQLLLDPVGQIQRADVLDSRDLAEVLKDLEEQQENASSGDADPLDEEEAQLLAELRDAESEVSDWSFGETFIAEGYFKTYAQDLADDIGAVDSDAGWPTCHIDWDAAADSLKQDYTEFELAGVTFYARA